MAVLDQEMTVYGGGDRDQALATGLRCRLTHVSGGQDAPSRAELAALRLLFWQPDYELPEDTVQIEIDGRRWNPVPGTYGAFRSQLGQVLARCAQVVRA